MRLAWMAAFLFLMQQQQTCKLASLVDTRRVLVVFAPADHDVRFQQQIALLANHAADMKDRDLVLVVNLIDPGPRPSRETLRARPAPYAFDQETLATRQRFHIQPNEFAVLLLGKDGEEKMRSQAPLPMARINRTIDAMPMRQEEMRQRTGTHG